VSQHGGVSVQQMREGAPALGRVLPVLDAAWVESLAPEHRELLTAACTPRSNRYIPHEPTPKQAAFLLMPQREVIYGGAAGGGKTDALLMAALQYADVPGYSALLLRRTFKQLNLAKSLIPRSHEWLARTDAKWHAADMRWSFPSGAVLDFGHCQHEHDKHNYQGGEYHFIGFDELTGFSLGQFSFLTSRLRRLAGRAPPSARLCTRQARRQSLPRSGNLRADAIRSRSGHARPAPQRRLECPPPRWLFQTRKLHDPR